MPTRFSRLLSVLFLASSSLPAWAEALVVTDGRHPVQASPGARVIELDQAARSAAELSAKLPAVVVDRRYVVYGEADVSRAVARIETYRRLQP